MLRHSGVGSGVLMPGPLAGSTSAPARPLPPAGWAQLTWQLASQRWGGDGLFRFLGVPPAASEASTRMGRVGVLPDQPEAQLVSMCVCVCVCVYVWGLCMHACESICVCLCVSRCV